MPGHAQQQQHQHQRYLFGANGLFVVLCLNVFFFFWGATLLTDVTNTLELRMAMLDRRMQQLPYSFAAGLRDANWCPVPTPPPLPSPSTQRKDDAIERLQNAFRSVRETAAATEKQ